MKRIPLTRGFEALVDDDDFEELSRFKWHANVTSKGAVYAARKSRRPDGTYSIVYMQRQITNPPDGMDCDHINGDRLDNRRCNLRSVTRSQNLRNAHTTISRGVFWCKQTRRWFARISNNGRRVFLGRFQSREDATAAVWKARSEIAAQESAAQKPAQ